MVAKKEINDGGFLLSHTVAHAVPSTRVSLTAVFGMGTGVASLLLPPSLISFKESQIYGWTEY